MMIFEALCKREANKLRLNKLMHLTMTRLLKFVPVVLLFLSSCSKDGCNQKMAFNYDPDGNSEENCVWKPIEVKIAFNPVVGDEPLELNKEVIVNGRALEMDFYGIYFTEITLQLDGDSVLLRNDNEACVTAASDAMLFEDANRLFESSYLPKADVVLNNLIFNIGVDTCRNNGLDPTTQLSGPFAPHVPTMYWSWASGYRFISLNGMVDVSANADGSDMQNFEYHTGLNSLLRTASIDMESRELDANTLIINLNVDFAKMLEGVDFTTNLSTHTFDNMPLAAKITENALTSITLD